MVDTRQLVMGLSGNGSLRAQELVTLVQLFKDDAARTFVDISGNRLGRELGISQQAASNRLVRLERLGLIERKFNGRRIAVLLTPPGVMQIVSLHRDLSSSYPLKGGRVEFEGSVFTGLGEGGYYVSIPGYQAQFRKTLGFVPFPGTLNIRLGPDQRNLRRQLQFLEGTTVSGFKQGRRTFGPVKCFQASVGGQQAAALAIERTHHDDSVLEIISPVNLRKTLNLSDGSVCRVTVDLA